MIIVQYNKKHHQQIIHAINLALKHGKVVAYPTDTSYGLAVDPTNAVALKKFYAIKERSIKKPVHIIVSSVQQAKKYVQWNMSAEKLSKKFWPGQLTLVLPVKSKESFVKTFAASTGSLGLRMPKNLIALDLVKAFKKPLTATSANPAGAKRGGYDSYSAEDIVKQFSKLKHKPDIIIDAGKLSKRKPSTLVKVVRENEFEILRTGPITKKQISKILSK